jgi:hypothetical protein
MVVQHDWIRDIRDSVHYSAGLRQHSILEDEQHSQVGIFLPYFERALL